MLFSGENYLLLKQIMRLTSTPCLKLLRCPILINGALEIKFALSKFVIFPYIMVFFFSFKKKNSFLAYKLCWVKSLGIFFLIIVGGIRPYN